VSTEYVASAERVGVALLVLATARLFAAFFLPWWSCTREGVVFVHPTVASDGFSGWNELCPALTMPTLASCLT